MEWYSIRTLAGKEKVARDTLKNEIDMYSMSNLVNDVIVPTEKKYIVKNGKRIIKEKLSMSGYIFINCHLVGELPKIIKSTKNIIGFTGDRNNNPMSIPESQMSKIIDNIEVEDSVIKDETPFLVDEIISIIDGPFKTFDGKIQKINHEKKKIEVIVTIFGREQPVELSYIQVDKV